MKVRKSKLRTTSPVYEYSMINEYISQRFFGVAPNENVYFLYNAKSSSLPDLQPYDRDHTKSEASNESEEDEDVAIIVVETEPE